METFRELSKQIIQSDSLWFTMGWLCSESI